MLRTSAAPGALSGEALQPQEVQSYLGVQELWGFSFLKGLSTKNAEQLKNQ